MWAVIVECVKGLMAVDAVPLTQDVERQLLVDDGCGLKVMCRQRMVGGRTGTAFLNAAGHVRTWSHFANSAREGCASTRLKWPAPCGVNNQPPLNANLNLGTVVHLRPPDA